MWRPARRGAFRGLRTLRFGFRFGLRRRQQWATIDRDARPCVRPPHSLGRTMARVSDNRSNVIVPIRVAATQVALEWARSFVRREVSG